MVYVTIIMSLSLLWCAFVPVVWRRYKEGHRRSRWRCRSQQVRRWFGASRASYSDRLYKCTEVCTTKDILLASTGWSVSLLLP